MELMRRMDASPISMTLGDVLPALQQGTIDGTLSGIIVYTTMRYYDVSKVILQIEQPFVNSLAIMSKRWLESLPPDLKKAVLESADEVSKDFNPYVKDFWVKQNKIWTDHGGEIVTVSKAEYDGMIAKVSSIGEDLSKSKPGLNATVKALFEAAKRNQ
jgi:TRAP-type C4-dicarboxylate transport system substrate-binding protein